jgi:flagellar motor component MotA
MFVASFVGVCSGIYIWKPFFAEMAANQAERKRQEALVAEAALNHPVNNNTSTIPKGGATESSKK